MRGSKLCMTVLPLALVACDLTEGWIADREEPNLCIAPASGADPEDGQDPACDPPHVRTGDPYRILHTMPDGIQLGRDLEIAIHTPCVTEVETHRHVDGIVDLTRIAPPGAECALAVEAVILNSELREKTPGGECAQIEEVCGGAEAGAER